MEKTEALLHIPLNEGELLNDVYEEKLFEWKNFFVNRFPVPKLFLNKLSQLRKLEEAYEALGGKSRDIDVISYPHGTNSLSFKQSFHDFNASRNQLKAKLFQAKNIPEVITVVEALLEVTADYAKNWTDHTIDMAGAVVSVELDPMDLMVAIDEAESLGVIGINEINDLPEDHLVLKEVKRLSLWSKMMENE